MKLKYAGDWLPIIQAAAEGKTIQYDTHDKEHGFVDIDPDEELYFLGVATSYRVKPSEAEEKATRDTMFGLLGATIRDKHASDISCRVLMVTEKFIATSDEYIRPSELKDYEKLDDQGNWVPLIAYPLIP